MPSPMGEMLSSQFMGPPEPDRYPYLGVEEPGMPEEPKVDVVKALTPLVMSQILDLISTEVLMKSPPLAPKWNNPREGNPLPGMQSTAGRIGWNALESAIMAIAMRKKPNLAMPVRDTMVGTHTGLARGNVASSEDYRMPVGHMITPASSR